MPSPPPTIILSHTAFHQPAHYIHFCAALNEVGLTEYRIPQLASSNPTPPKTDALAQDIAILRKTIRSCLSSGRDVLLVAHGYGGVPLSDAVSGLGDVGGRKDARVLGVVFVAGVVASEGEGFGSAMGSGVAGWVRLEGDTCTAMNPEMTFYNTVASKELVEEAVDHIRPQSTTSLMSPLGQAGWTGFPCAYIKCTQDNAIFPKDQDHMVAKLQKQCEWKPTIVELASDHSPFLGCPQKVAGMLKRLVDEADRAE
ncbi:hypothetical protein LTR62_005713 [Meristemomyces frigidus]|uniref:AB hydrolase-1 domain-containing protein n=1 Tax=Meristemomyces frigidus TaxID=1508187 RepID=A0AAN7TP41_9PEZI|nr:hypothetical protein LTR62_005713 [Meristemomyces frigidus]